MAGETKKLRGIDGQIYIGSDKIGALRDYDLTITMGTTDDSDHDSGGWGSTMTTIAKWKLSVKAWNLFGDAAQAAVRTAIVAGTALSFKFWLDGAGAGKPEWTGSGRCTNIAINSPMTGPQEHNMDFEGVGELDMDGTQSA